MTWTETIEKYLREGRTVSGGKHAKSGQQTQLENVGNQDFAGQTQDTAAARGTLQQFQGPVQQSPFYKALLTSGIEGTSRAYNNARANTRQRAGAAGFGYNQPVAQGADNELGAREATDLAAVPRQAAIAATGPALQSAGMSGQMGLSEGLQGLQANQGAYNMNQRRRTFWDDLQRIGPMAAGAAEGFMGAGG
jgi:hypothetical protein